MLTLRLMQMEKFRIAVLDMYNDAPNEGMRCIHEIIADYFTGNEIPFEIENFPVRSGSKLPADDFDAYISSGGPGSPLINHEPWVENYFSWISRLESHNKHKKKCKPVFFICYSFQLACRYFGIGQISQRHATSFGIFPIDRKNAIHPLIAGLPKTFPAFDNRDFQVLLSEKTNHNTDTAIIAHEHIDSHADNKPAVMALQFNKWMWGTQFHPEADASGMLLYLQREERKQQIVQMHGIEKWEMMMRQAENPQEFQFTRNHILPNFLQFAITCKNMDYDD